jgi:hypothetical protein
MPMSSGRDLQPSGEAEMMVSVREGSIANLSPRLDGKLAGYLAATSAIGAVLSQEAQAIVVANTAVQPFGINGVVNIDFNNDTQIDFQIDHDRVNLNGTNLDYLQVDKNDINGETNPLATDPYFFTTFPTTTLHYTPFPINQSSHRNDDAMVLSYTNDFGDQGGYAVGLDAGDLIGGTGSAGASLIPGAIWDWQEGADFNGTGKYIRANRLIDEDHGQIDAAATPPRAVTYPQFPFGPQPEFPDLDDFSGLSPTDVRYVGVRVDLNDAGYPGNPFSNANAATLDDPANYWYGWIGIRITNEADATGEVVGYAYESQKGMPIMAGEGGPPWGGPGDYNGNNVVDAADYTVWRDGGPLLNEGASLGTIDAADYDFWKTQFGMVPGNGAGAGGVAVPEPGSMIIAAIGGVLVLGAFVARKLFAGDMK